MYQQMFGFREKPFHITPNPRFIFLSKIHREAFAHLLYGIQQRVGFLSLTGEVGTGKTTILRTLLGQLEEADYRVALIFNPCLSALELLQTIHKELSIEFDSERSNLAQLHDSLNRYLLGQREAGKTVVLVVDEAQNLDPSVLEQLRLLSNLETETEKLIQMVLVGQPELEQLLERKDLRQLRQRITVRFCLRAMDIEDTTAYVHHRLKVAGWQSGHLFSEKALRLVYKFTGGVPRLINILCDRALLVAYGRDSRMITLADVRTAHAELESQEQPKRTWYLPVSIGLALLFLFGYYSARFLPVSPPPAAETAVAIEQQPASPPPQATEIPPEPVTPAGEVVIDPERIELLKAAITSIPVSDCSRSALAAMLELWNKNSPGATAVTGTVGSIKSTLKTAGFSILDLQLQFDDLIEQDTPVMLVVILPGVSGSRLFTLTAANDTAVRIEPALTESGWLDRQELQQVWFGQALLPYINFSDIQLISRPGQAGEQVLLLQDLLQRTGTSPSPGSGIYDQLTIDAVTRFQMEHRLVPDGRVGAQTLFWLYKDAGLKMPRLTGGEAG